ncbi:hypothetical protein HPG02_00265 [Pediococcus pentosaceus]|uniref:hypothetical protein n=1 Tax=Pediococcus pentosaceus TaxID=1255 RepID=UPI001C1ED47E|nr:hypothetical protein [Pediococcus pentosaceus]MBU7002072.1 hypothetical protein [Pediococcus pentosaceus]MCG9227435.1 hypothetical protein [Pediococcus pentosaceus]MDA8037488.1 hypothetical protein [Pediococcus pentosaceus]
MSLKKHKNLQVQPEITAGPETKRLITDLGEQVDRYRQYLMLLSGIIVFLVAGLIGGFHYATNQMTEVASQAAAKVKKANVEEQTANARIKVLESNDGETLTVKGSSHR